MITATTHERVDDRDYANAEVHDKWSGSAYIGATDWTHCLQLRLAEKLILRT